MDLDLDVNVTLFIRKRGQLRWTGLGLSEPAAQAQGSECISSCMVDHRVSTERPTLALPHPQSEAAIAELTTSGPGHTQAYAEADATEVGESLLGELQDVQC